MISDMSYYMRSLPDIQIISSNNRFDSICLLFI